MTLEQISCYAEINAVEEALDEKWLPDSIASVIALIENPIWQRDLIAKQKHHEYSFMVNKKDEAGKETLMKGIIDYLFEEADGWVLVDFKTDAYDDEHEQSFIDYYKPQVMAYVHEWEQTFGMKVKEPGLYFVGKG